MTQEQVCLLEEINDDNYIEEQRLRDERNMKIQTTNKVLDTFIVFLAFSICLVIIMKK